MRKHFECEAAGGCLVQNESIHAPCHGECDLLARDPTEEEIVEWYDCPIHGLFLNDCPRC